LCLLLVPCTLFLVPSLWVPQQTRNSNQPQRSCKQLNLREAGTEQIFAALNKRRKPKILFQSRQKIKP
jgi:hypothetical protein